MNAAQPDSPTSSVALDQLCQTYWPPLYTYIRQRGHDPEQAKDLTQEFFRQLLERNAFAVANREKGKFRSFLLASANHFLANEWARNNAQKRGGGKVIVSLDDSAEAELDGVGSGEAPETAFDRRWAITVLGRGLHQLEAEFKSSGKEAHFQNLNRFLTEPATDEDYKTVAAQLRVSPGAISVAVYRMRQRFRDLVRAEIAETVSTEAEVDEEMRYLLSVLG
jgi:RNA polymerase sigma-70 factor (ECF subfamily)